MPAVFSSDCPFGAGRELRAHMANDSRQLGSNLCSIYLPKGEFFLLHNIFASRRVHGLGQVGPKLARALLI